MYESVQIRREIHGDGENLLICGSVLRLPAVVRELNGQVQCVYADPPFMTGERFTRSRPYGAKGWKKGSPVLKIPAYEDRYADEKEYLRLLRRLITVSRDLLAETGVFYLHMDWRMSAQARQLCDRILGRENFLNEIIWSYESGGRAKRSFSRKHETVLMYAKGPDYIFDITKVPLSRSERRRNHMARVMDEDGRMYSRIVSGGKEYRYYDDEPVYPGDVWTDIGFLQQRDPERTGYATQKPLKLLERLLLPVTRPGDRVADLCCGSGTTLVAAQKLGCRFAGMDLNPEAIVVSLARLKPENLTVICPVRTDGARLLTEEDADRFRLEGIALEEPLLPEKGTPSDNLEAWETGRVEKGVFYAARTYQRSFRYPELVQSLEKTKGVPEAIMTTDAAGIRRCFVRKREKTAET